MIIMSVKMLIATVVQNDIVKDIVNKFIVHIDKNLRKTIVKQFLKYVPIFYL